MTRKHYFLGNERHNRPQQFLMRSNVIAKYRGAIQQYRTLRVFKQIFEVMNICRENGGYIAKGEFVAILREQISTEFPTGAELNHFNAEVFMFRRWLGALAGMLVYVRREHVASIHALEWIYRPIKTRQDYEEVRRHINKTSRGLDKRNEENLKLLSKTPKQIDAMIEDVAEQLDLEAKGHRA